MRDAQGDLRPASLEQNARGSTRFRKRKVEIMGHEAAHERALHDARPRRIASPEPRLVVLSVVVALMVAAAVGAWRSMEPTARDQTIRQVVESNAHPIWRGERVDATAAIERGAPVAGRFPRDVRAAPPRFPDRIVAEFGAAGSRPQAPRSASR
jgi:hypothetical protein